MFDFIVFENAGLTVNPEHLNLSHSDDALTARELVRLTVLEQQERLKAEPATADRPLRRLRAQDAQALVEGMIEKTCKAMSGNQVFLLVDGQHITDLDVEIPIVPAPKIEFFRLVPLKGG